MSMTPSEDEATIRTLLSDPSRWRSEPAVREAAAVRAGLEQARVMRAQSILQYLNADRSGWPEGVDQMLRVELGIDTLLAAGSDQRTIAPEPTTGAVLPDIARAWPEPVGDPAFWASTVPANEGDPR